VNKLTYLWVRYGTQKNLKVATILFTLIALAVAGGAPGDGSGSPGSF
jgi:hypothetical protein